MKPQSPMATISRSRGPRQRRHGAPWTALQSLHLPNLQPCPQPKENTNGLNTPTDSGTTASPAACANSG